MYDTTGGYAGKVEITENGKYLFIAISGREGEKEKNKADGGVNPKTGVKAKAPFGRTEISTEGVFINV